MNSMLDSLTKAEKKVAYSGSPINLYLHRLYRKLRRLRNEEEFNTGEEHEQKSN